MSIHEVDILGLFVSPIFLMVILAAIATSLVARLLNLAIPYSLHRNESLLCALCFVWLLVLMARHTFNG